ncbi:predicted protein [Pyrenophora tritici-repentis Pt-1C-BFP]|uniref:Uncharacterized protein n=1 Tax=Pyrenophora tritici-repentis (strain Pt-1C-BFP) TaxID=426418 RepID=B2WNI5_PYRTR|nr:uncharacterized protein PTRG_11545 [Pyrenophora tritici-repentis Pt-1C-BFP]EDU44595.1 predicted protein [Pyrenophora tritici-repentis Pt-1C-BFP]
MAPLYPYQATVPASHPHNFQMHVPGTSIPTHDIALKEFAQGFVLGALLFVAFLIALFSVQFCIWAATMISDGETKEEMWSTGDDVGYNSVLMN